MSIFKTIIEQTIPEIKDNIAKADYYLFGKEFFYDIEMTNLSSVVVNNENARVHTFMNEYKISKKCHVLSLRAATTIKPFSPALEYRISLDDTLCTLVLSDHTVLKYNIEDILEESYFFQQSTLYDLEITIEIIQELLQIQKTMTAISDYNMKQNNHSYEILNQWKIE